MTKKKTLKRRKGCFDDIPIIETKKVRAKKFDPEERLREKSFVAQALFEALSEGDEEAALEIINAYLQAMSKAEIARQEKIAMSTVYHALSPKANPTLRTLAKLFHAVA